MARLVVDVVVVGSLASVLAVQYWDGGVWRYLDNVSGPVVTVGSVLAFNGAAINIGSWATLAPGARAADRVLRLVGSGGDGVANPSFGTVFLQFG